MYSPNRFYLTFLRNNSWNLEKNVNIKSNLHFNTNIWFYLSFFRLTSISSFLSKPMPSLFCEWVCNNNNDSNNNYIQTFPGKKFFGISINYFYIKVISWRKTVLRTSTRMQCKAGKDSRGLFSIPKEMTQKWYLWQEQLKSVSTIWKPS